MLPIDNEYGFVVGNLSPNGHISRIPGKDKYFSGTSNGWLQLKTEVRPNVW